MAKNPWIWAIAGFLAEAALQVSGYENQSLAVALAIATLVFLGLGFIDLFRKRATRRAAMSDVKIGDEAVAIGDVSGTVGTRAVAIGPTDNRGNTTIDAGTIAIGHGAKAGPGSIAIGAGARAGVGDDVISDK